MPRTIIKHPKDNLRCSLGRLAYWWMKTFVVYGPGAVRGQSLNFGPERLSDLYHMYALDPDTGKRLHSSAFLSKCKGADKSGMAGYLVCFEAVGPCRFDGWAQGGETYTFLGHTYVYKAGEPMGRPVLEPVIRCMATEENQTSNVYEVALFNFQEGPLAALDVAAFDGYIETPGNGKIYPSTSGAASKDGGRETFVVFDEALALDTPLPTPTGWTTMGEVQVGDLLLGSNGEPTQVIKTTEVQENRDCYRVSFADGTSIVASAGHLWQIKKGSGWRHWETRTTEELADLQHSNQLYVPMLSGSAHPWGQAEDLPIDPWFLGMWLGDGDARNATISVGRDDQADTTRLIESRGYNVSACHVADDKASLLYVSEFGSGKGHHDSGLKAKLRTLGVLGNKHIPEQYLLADEESRRLLLQGLMDSDGHVDKNGRFCTFVTNNVDFARQVTRLARSLGEHVKEPIVTPDNRSRTGVMCKVSWTVATFVPFKLKRKADRVRLDNGRATRTGKRILRVEPVDSVPVKCVGVRAADHLFLAGEGFTVTHNTHLWNIPRLRRAYSTVKRNLTKRPLEEPWYLETTTMYAPGEESVAEKTYELALKIQEGKTRSTRLLFIHQYGVIKKDDIADEVKLRAALDEAAGEAAAWLDANATIHDHFYDPREDLRDSIRYYLNALEGAAASWIEYAVVEDLTVDEVFEPGDEIALGFDGSLTGDSTALVGVRLRDNLVQVLHLQEAPLDPKEAKLWSVDKGAVNKAVYSARETYTVKAFFGDPPFYQDEMAEWQKLFGDEIAPYTPGNPIMWWTSRKPQTAKAVERTTTLFRTRGIKLSRNPALIRHIQNTRVWPRPEGDLIGKELKNSPKKMDISMAMVLGVEAAAHARTYVPKEKKEKDVNHGLIAKVPLEMLVPGKGRASGRRRVGR